jgi:hypothetical protein
LHQRRRSHCHLPHSLLHSLTKLIARDKAVGVNQKQNICQHPSSFAAGKVWGRPSEVWSILCC